MSFRNSAWGPCNTSSWLCWVESGWIGAPKNSVNRIVYQEVSVRFHVRLQAESANFRWIPTWEPKSQGKRLKALLKRISLSNYGSKGFRVRLRRLSVYGSVAVLKDMGNTGRTVLGHHPSVNNLTFPIVDPLEMFQPWRRFQHQFISGFFPH